jgi:hypothetical protein
MSSGSRLLLIGLRGSGKTSYLAALWHLIEAGELPTGLTTSQLQPNREYLNRIRDNWLRFQEVGRTSLRSQEMVSLLLRDARTDATIDITLPDVSGELFRLQWVTRKATRTYADFAADSSGVFLFIHPAAVRRAPRISLPATESLPSTEVAPPLEACRVEPGSEASISTQLTEWSPNLTPTQVQLVELLQFVACLGSTGKPTRIAAVISAWDLVRDPILPISWLESHLPLLFQFLVANASAMPFRAYGVSALGGDLEKDLERLQDEAVPSRRIKVVENRLDSHGDLTAPIRFLLDLDGDRPRSVRQ